jgi:hypothetical protein
VEEVILDGEITWDLHSGYHVFDILWLNGHNVTSLPLEDRRALLRELPLTAPMRRVELLDDAEPWDRARREGWEGVIAKRRGSPYEHRRSKHWLKMKCELSQELVVGGFTDPQGARVGLGALLVGYYEGRDLVFAGKIGTGFDTKLRLDLRTRLDALEVSRPPFTKAVGLPRLRARTGCDPRSSFRSASSNGRRTTSCATRVCSASASISGRKTSSVSIRLKPDSTSGSSRDHDYASGQSAVS